MLVFNLFSSNNVLTTGAQGNINAVINTGGGHNTITAGGPGNLNLGFNFFGSTNAVTAGPGPLTLAGSVFKDGQTITKTKPGIAINSFRVGGAAATPPQANTAPKAQATSASKTRREHRKATEVGADRRCAQEMPESALCDTDSHVELDERRPFCRSEGSRSGFDIGLGARAGCRFRAGRSRSG